MKRLLVQRTFPFILCVTALPLLSALHIMEHHHHTDSGHPSSSEVFSECDLCLFFDEHNGTKEEADVLCTPGLISRFLQFPDSISINLIQTTNNLRAPPSNVSSDMLA